ncbi:hypothetical protein JK364_00220 [Streptomyces sp. 110]|uniref:Uncharacterized protein n=1 Tax=Streptomyces endocoffeicus TaxID=2898945 RepID=A0ABS1PEQ2_9ACTN|nr:hypothetical protein [Streptomyces endocoffeicus]MBL1110847.1 hypothetical protein [Streptomyces endocoffeicus]
MARTKFDKQAEESAEYLMFGIGRILTGRDLDGVKRTGAMFWRSGTRCLVEAALTWPKPRLSIRHVAHCPHSAIAVPCLRTSSGELEERPCPDWGENEGKRKLERHQMCAGRLKRGGRGLRGYDGAARSRFG